MLSGGETIAFRTGDDIPIKNDNENEDENDNEDDNEDDNENEYK